MSLPVQEVVPLPEIRAPGTDGRNYVVRPVQWNVDKVKEAWENFQQFEIFSDDGPQNMQGFLQFIFTVPQLWFEVIDEDTKEQVGLVYLNGLQKSMNRKGYTKAQFHAAMWDAKAAPRKELADIFIDRIFDMLKLHRLEALVPLHHGGAIRFLHRMGFQDDGVLRKSAMYKGEWVNQLVLSILDEEV